MEFDKSKVRVWHNRENIVGKTFNYLTVLKDLPNKNGKRYVLCKCICGKEIGVYKSTLTQGLKKSCGCRKYENHPYLRSGSRKDALYRIYASIKNRCLNTKTPRYIDYGGRGIKICKEWLDDYSNFHDWAFCNGYSDGKNLSIERKDVNGNYCPENCCWIPKPEQNRNKRNSHFITLNGKTMILADWCRELGISSSLVVHRIKDLGMSEEKALMTPVKR